MPSTLSYARMGMMVDKNARENNLVQDLVTKFTSFASHDHQHTSVDTAKFIYGNAASLMNKHRLDSLSYYKCVAKAIKRTNNLSNTEEIITELIKLIEDSANPLREMVKKGGQS